MKRNKQTRTKRRQPLREINHSLKHELDRGLKDEHCKIKREIEGFHFLGDEVICPENSIQEIECKEDLRWTREGQNLWRDFTMLSQAILPHQVNVDLVSKGNDIHYNHSYHIAFKCTMSCIMNKEKKFSDDIIVEQFIIHT